MNAAYLYPLKKGVKMNQISKDSHLIIIARYICIIAFLFAFAPSEAVASPRMEVTFLGNTTLYVSDGETSILVDGFMSRNPFEESFFPAGDLIKCKVRPQRIDSYLSQGRVTNVDLIVVGHSHYDHALDFAYIAAYLFPEAKIFGSNSTKIIGLGTGLEEGRFFPVVGAAPASIKMGRFTVKMIPSIHGNPWMYKGDITNSKPFRYLNDPHTGAAANQFKDGGVYTIIVRHEGHNRDTRSLLVQNSAGYSAGVPKLTEQVDAAFIAVSGLGSTLLNDRDNYYKNMVENTKARLVVPLHWDNFFEDLNDILNNPSTYPYLLNDNVTGALHWISQKTNPDVPATLSWILKKLSIAAAIEPAFFAVMEPVQSAQKTVTDTSFKVSFSPPFSGLYFLLLGRDWAMLFSTG
jgi:L-ascorbate metabolism protein UlaG (beta-lactamase superfamily)